MKAHVLGDKGAQIILRLRAQATRDRQLQRCLRLWQAATAERQAQTAVHWQCISTLRLSFLVQCLPSQPHPVMQKTQARLHVSLLKPEPWHERSWTWRGSHGNSSTPRCASCGSAVAAQRLSNLRSNCYRWLRWPRRVQLVLLLLQI